VLHLAVEVEPLASSAEPGGQDEGPAVDAEPHVAHERLVEDGIDLLLVVYRPLRQPLDLTKKRERV
jgi:hypothetical protein